MAPLTKRLPRELRNNMGKYLGIFLLMTLTIALTSGFLLASHSISVIINEIPETYQLEDGRFSTSFAATSAQLKAAEEAAKDEGGVVIHQDWYTDADFKGGTDDDTRKTLRTYTQREGFNVAAYAEGAKPAAANEIAVDRVFATNNNVAVGSEVKVAGLDFKVVGILTMPDYQALFQDNSSFTINTLTFGVAEVTKAGFQALQDADAAVIYNYSFAFNDANLTVAQRTDIEKDMIETLGDADASVNDLIDIDSNQGAVYASDDVEGDSTMWLVLLYIIIVIMAFVFVVLTSATIEEESAVIGTLLASGYRRGELVRHYLALPTIVGVVAAVVGTALGLTVFSAPMQNLYYGSYSLPPYYVSWDWMIFAKTTATPVLLLFFVTLIGLLRKIGHTPLQFLRHETSKNGTKGSIKLPERLSFTARFRLRVFLRSLGNFATLLIGIFFGATLLLFGLAVLPTMTHYASNLRDTVVANHEYTLKAPLEIEGTDDERQVWSDIAKLQTLDQTKLSEVQDEADDLQARGDDLQARADDLEARANNLQARASNLQAQANNVKAQGSDLQNRSAQLQAQATEELTAKGAAVQAAAEEAQKLATAAQADPTDENRAAAAEAQAKAQQLNTELEQLKASFEEQGNALAAEGEKLTAQGNALTAQGNALTAEGNTLESESNALLDEKDALEAERDALYEKIDALAAEIGVTRDEFEDMADRIEGIDLDDDNLHPVNTTDNGADKIAQAEKYAVYQLEYDRGGDAGIESITVYGISENSRYWENLNVGSGRVVFGGGLIDKFGFTENTSIALYDKYEDETYNVTLESASDTWGSKSDMAIYMALSDFNTMFGNDSGYFNAYASDEALALDSRYLASDLTPEDMDAIGEQFVGMMNDMIGMIVGLAVAIFLIFMYLLTKSIIDRSARSISYMKVFGYRDREVSKLYVRSITWCVVITIVVCQPLVIESLTWIFRAMLLQYSGNIEIFVPTVAIVESIAIAVATYAVVALLHMRSIRRVPLSIALKVQE